jgi:hypothetical protein
MALQLDALSRFIRTENVRKNNATTYGLWVRPRLLTEAELEESDIIKVPIDQEYNGRPDLIANNFYNDPMLEWVVIMFNRPADPLNWPKAGTVIKIPSKAVVFSTI